MIMIVLSKTVEVTYGRNYSCETMSWAGGTSRCIAIETRKQQKINIVRFVINISNNHNLDEFKAINGATGSEE